MKNVHLDIITKLEGVPKRLLKIAFNTKKVLMLPKKYVQNVIKKCTGMWIVNSVLWVLFLTALKWAMMKRLVMSARKGLFWIKLKISKIIVIP